jgi:hypothetical protein
MDGRDQGEQAPTVTQVTIGPRISGRSASRCCAAGFDDIDGTPGHYAAVINQRFAAMHFGTDDPIGRRIKLTPDGAQPPRGARMEPPSWVDADHPPATQQGDDTPDPVARPLRARARHSRC